MCLYTFDQPGSQTENISSVIFHPDMPIIISGSEDDTVNIYDTTTYKLISQLQYGLKRVWSIAAAQDSNTLAFGFDEGTIVVKMGKDLPLASFVNGKVVQIKQKEIQTFNLKLLQGADEESKDGELVKPQNVKELGICEVNPSAIKFAPSGRYFAVMSENDFVVYTYPKYQNAAFGQANDLVWATDKAQEQAHTYACRTENGTVKVYQNFAEYKAFKTAFSNEGLFGGRLLAIRSKDFVTFYDWEEYRVVRRIDLSAQLKHIIWSEDGNYLVIAMEESFYLLRYNASEVTNVFNTRELNEEE